MRYRLLLSLVFAAAPLAAQDRGDQAAVVQAPQSPTAEQIVEAASEKLRLPNLPKPCPPGANGEIVVCAPVQASTGVPSSLEDAIREGRAVPDGKPRAPDVFGIPPCKSYMLCSRIGPAPAAPLLIDLKAIPEAPPGSDAARYKEDAEAERGTATQ